MAKTKPTPRNQSRQREKASAADSSPNEVDGRPASTEYKEEQQEDGQAETKSCADSQSVSERQTKGAKRARSTSPDSVVEAAEKLESKNSKEPSPEAPVLRRSGRVRKPVIRNTIIEESRKPKQLHKKNRRSVMGIEANWKTHLVYTSRKSPLGSANLRTLLLHNTSETWEVLSPTERGEIISLFPNLNFAFMLVEGIPDFAELDKSEGFKNACKAYTTHIAQGKHEAAWIKSATVAHQKRQRGEYDEWLKQYFKNNAGMDLDESLAPDRSRQP